MVQLYVPLTLVSLQVTTGVICQGVPVAVTGIDQSVLSPGARGDGSVPVSGGVDIPVGLPLNERATLSGALPTF